MRSDFRTFLSDHGLLPIKAPRWASMTVFHRKPRDRAERDGMYRQIKDTVGPSCGLYAYFNASGQLLYVGKGAPIWGRIKSHYRESFEAVPGDTRTHRWHRFFRRHAGKLTVFWLPLDDEADRRIIEKMIERVEQPLFTEFT